MTMVSLPVTPLTLVGALISILIIFSLIASVIFLLTKNKTSKKIAKYGWIATLILFLVYLLVPHFMNSVL